MNYPWSRDSNAANNRYSSELKDDSFNSDAQLRQIKEQQTSKGVATQEHIKWNVYF